MEIGGLVTYSINIMPMVWLLLNRSAHILRMFKIFLSFFGPAPGWSCISLKRALIAVSVQLVTSHVDEAEGQKKEPFVLTLQFRRGYIKPMTLQRNHRHSFTFHPEFLYCEYIYKENKLICSHMLKMNLLIEWLAKEICTVRQSVRFIEVTFIEVQST